MREGFKLGNFTFDSEEEYKNALKELKVIQGLKQKYDIDNPDVAKYLLSKIGKGSIHFDTQIGDAFENYLQNVLNQKKSKKTDVPIQNLSYIKIDQKKRSTYSLKYVWLIVIVFIAILVMWYLLLKYTR